MMRSALSITREYLTREIIGVHQAAYVLAAFSLLSSVLALGRDRLLAHLFGAGSILDVYYAAFRIPDLLFVVGSSVVSVYAIIPMLASRTQDEQNRAVDSIVAAFALSSICIASVLAIVMPYVLPHVFAGQLAANQNLISISRILLLQPILLGISNIFASITQSRRRYILYAATPIVYNLGIIFGAYVLYPLWGLQGLACGVCLGALLHASIQLPAVFRDGFLHAFPRLTDKKAIYDVVKISLPRAAALSVGQLTSLYLASVASALNVGSITVFMFAFNLQSVPLSMIGASYSVAAFPTLARMAAAGNTSSFREHVLVASRHVVLWSVPISALLFILRAHVVRAILGSGAFDWTDTRLTAAVLGIFAISIPANALTLIIVRAYYATGNVRWPLIATVCGGLVTCLSALMLRDIFNLSPAFHSAADALMRVTGVPGTVVMSLSLAYVLGSYVALCLLLLKFSAEHDGYSQGMSNVIGESVLAAVVGSVSGYVVLRALGGLTPATTFVAIAFDGFVAGAVGIVIIFTALVLLKSPEISELATVLKAKTRAVIPLFASAEEEIS